jgi:hypothetical protein
MRPLALIGLPPAGAPFGVARVVKMKLMILDATALIGTTANAKSVKKNVAPPADRHFDAAHGPDDPHSVWLAIRYSS